MLIAQVTDTHIRKNGQKAYGRVDTYRALRETVDHLNGLTPRPDAVVVSGDLVDGGSAEEYATARPLLDRLQMPYYAVPGNHDERENFRRAFADKGYLPATGFLNYVIEDFPVRLVGLDSVVPGQPHGDLCPERLDWLAQCLAADRQKPTLVFLHHPPFLTGINHMDAMMCQNGESLGAIIQEHPQVQMLLCGHIHRIIHTTWHGIAACIGGSPAHAVAFDLTPDGPAAFVMEPPTSRLVHLTTDNRLVADLTFIGSFPGPFLFNQADDRPAG